MNAFALGDDRHYDILIVDAGWPARSLHRVQTHVVSRSNIPGRRLPIDDQLQWLRTVRPIWPGFAINTVFDAAILWLLFAAPFALRRRWRFKRGLCPKCAYPVGASEVCAECGAPRPVTPKALSG
jgi:hypothetical protein